MRRFFDAASVEQHPVDKAMNLVRLAAYCIKRKKAYPRSQAALERAVGILDDSERSIKPAERHGCLASVYNLASLLALHTDGPMESARSLEAALDHAREAVMYPDRRSENARYGIQIFCNLAQLHCLREEYEEAHKAILDNGTVFLNTRRSTALRSIRASHTSTTWTATSRTRRVTRERRYDQSPGRPRLSG